VSAKIVMLAMLVMALDPAAVSTHVEWGLCGGEFQRVGSVDTVESTVELPTFEIGRHCGRATSFSVEGGASDAAWFGVPMPEAPTGLVVR
jgi:hypothetical protein